MEWNNKLRPANPFNGTPVITMGEDRVKTSMPSNKFNETPLNRIDKKVWNESLKKFLGTTNIGSIGTTYGKTPVGYVINELVGGKLGQGLPKQTITDWLDYLQNYKGE